MRLIKAVDIAKACGLKTLNEAQANIEIHALNVFNYDIMQEELEELHYETLGVFELFGVDKQEDDITIEEFENYQNGGKL